MLYRLAHTKYFNKTIIVEPYFCFAGMEQDGEDKDDQVTSEANQSDVSMATANEKEQQASCDQVTSNEVAKQFTTPESCDGIETTQDSTVMDKEQRSCDSGSVSEIADNKSCDSSIQSEVDTKTNREFSENKEDNSNKLSSQLDDTLDRTKNEKEDRSIDSFSQSDVDTKAVGEGIFSGSQLSSAGSIKIECLDHFPVYGRDGKQVGWKRREESELRPEFRGRMIVSPKARRDTGFTTVDLTRVETPPAEDVEGNELLVSVSDDAEDDAQAEDSGKSSEPNIDVCGGDVADEDVSLGIELTCSLSSDADVISQIPPALETSSDADKVVAAERVEKLSSGISLHTEDKEEESGDSVAALESDILIMQAESDMPEISTESLKGEDSVVDGKTECEEADIESDVDVEETEMGKDDEILVLDEDQAKLGDVGVCVDKNEDVLDEIEDGNADADEIEDDKLLDDEEGEEMSLDQSNICSETADNLASADDILYTEQMHISTNILPSPTEKIAKEPKTLEENIEKEIRIDISENSFVADVILPRTEVDELLSSEDQIQAEAEDVILLNEDDFSSLNEEESSLWLSEKEGDNARDSELDDVDQTAENVDPALQADEVVDEDQGYENMHQRVENLDSAVLNAGTEIENLDSTVVNVQTDEDSCEFITVTSDSGESSCGIKHTGDKLVQEENNSTDSETREETITDKDGIEITSKDSENEEGTDEKSRGGKIILEDISEVSSVNDASTSFTIVTECTEGERSLTDIDVDECHTSDRQDENANDESATMTESEFAEDEGSQTEENVDIVEESVKSQRSERGIVPFRWHAGGNECRFTE